MSTLDSGQVGCAFSLSLPLRCLERRFNNRNRRRDEWISTGVMDELREMVLDAYETDHRAATRHT